MHRWFAVVVAVAGCGRFGFGPPDQAPDAALPDGAPDARVCVAPIGHDEDGDTTDDACDVCPQRADDQRDADGDGIGDACDLQGSIEQRTLFDAFTGTRPEWNYNGAETIANDMMHIPGVGDSIGEKLVDAPARNTWELGGAVLAGGAGSRQLSMQIGPTAGPEHYYCELYDDGTTLHLQFEYTYDGTSFMGVASSGLIPGRLDAGVVRMTVEHTPPSMRCLATWKGVDYEAAGLIPGGIVPAEFKIAVNNVDVDLAYFVRLANP